jgi:tetratricopeptide (TPR) repeat protein
MARKGREEAPPPRGPFAPERLEEAITRLRELTERQPANQQAFYQLGVAHLQHSDPLAAVGPLRRAAELKPDDPGTLYLLGVSLADTGDADGAEASWRRLLAIEPGHAVTRYMLGRLLAVCGRLDAAAAELEQALQGAPAGSAPSGSATPPAFLARAAEALGEVRLALGDRRAALAAWRRGLQQEPNNLVLLGNVAAGLLDLGHFEQAIEVCARAKRLGDRRPIVDYNLGLARLAKGDLHEAVLSLRAAAAGAPDDLLVRVRRAGALAAAGQSKAAWTELDVVLAKAPDNADALTQAGALRLAEGDEGSAEELWTRAGEHAPARSALAALAERRERWDEADAMWQGLAASDAANPLPWLRRGLIALRRGDPKAAGVLAGEALARAPGLPEANAVLGLAELRTGKGPDRLRKAGRRAVEDLLTPEERRAL